VQRRAPRVPGAGGKPLIHRTLPTSRHGRYRRPMRDVQAVFHRTKQVSIYPIEGDRFLIAATLQDEVHDVHVEIEIVHPTLEIVAARSEVRNGPFTAVCNLTQPNMAGLVGMRVARVLPRPVLGERVGVRGLVRG